MFSPAESPCDSPNPAQARLAVRRGDREKGVRECDPSRDDCTMLLALVLVKVLSGRNSHHMQDLTNEIILYSSEMRNLGSIPWY
jgi:hypothetical protein